MTNPEVRTCGNCGTQTVVCNFAVIDVYCEKWQPIAVKESKKNCNNSCDEDCKWYCITDKIRHCFYTESSGKRKYEPVKGSKEKDVEELSAEFHRVYMIEAKRQGDVRHKDKYEDLAENVKEFDRVLARYVLMYFKKNEPVSKEYEEKLEQELQAFHNFLSFYGVIPTLPNKIHLIRQEGIKRGREEAIKEIEGMLKEICDTPTIKPGKYCGVTLMELRKRINKLKEVK